MSNYTLMMMLLLRWGGSRAQHNTESITCHRQRHRHCGWRQRSSSINNNKKLSDNILFIIYYLLNYTFYLCSIWKVGGKVNVAVCGPGRGHCKSSLANRQICDAQGGRWERRGRREEWVKEKAAHRPGGPHWFAFGNKFISMMIPLYKCY